MYIYITLRYQILRLKKCKLFFKLNIKGLFCLIKNDREERRIFSEQTLSAVQVATCYLLIVINDPLCL